MDIFVGEGSDTKCWMQLTLKTSRTVKYVWGDFPFGFPKKSLSFKDGFMATVIFTQAEILIYSWMMW